MTFSEALAWCADHHASIRCHPGVVIVEFYVTPNHLQGFRAPTLIEAVQKAISRA